MITKCVAAPIEDFQVDYEGNSRQVKISIDQTWGELINKIRSISEFGIKQEAVFDVRTTKSAVKLESGKHEDKTLNHIGIISGDAFKVVNCRPGGADTLCG